MLNIYIYKKIDNLPHIPLLDYYFGPTNLGVKRYGDEALKLFNKQFFNLVEKPEEADYFLIPHNFFYIKDQNYINQFIQLSKKYSKKIIIFSYGDSDANINVSNSIIFRTSQYAYKKKPNEIIMPAIADDLLGERGLILRNRSSKPVVGFCGWAEYESLYRRFIENIKLLSTKNSGFRKRGLLFRIEAIKYLSKSNLILHNFIIRDSFSGNEKTRKLNLEIARAEYVENITDSDLSLAVKGDGNFSIRFYEILSLGRIPLFVDTNSTLPLEDVVDYDSFILKVDSKNIKEIAKLCREFYDKMSQSEFIEKQQKARGIFETYLRADKYFAYTLTSEFLKKYE